ncbi:hypothetical protein D3C78_1378570 [compost metagenome]
MGFVQAGVQAEAGLLVAPRQAHAAFPGTLASGCQAHARLQAGAFGAPGEDLHHAANGIRAIESGARAAQDFDTLDLVDAEMLQAGAASGNGAGALAVDQHQALGCASAADEQADIAATASALHDLHARNALKQFWHARRLQSLDIGASEDGICRCGLLA